MISHWLFYSFIKYLNYQNSQHTVFVSSTSSILLIIILSALPFSTIRYRLCLSLIRRDTEMHSAEMLLLFTSPAVVLRLPNRDQYPFHCTRCSFPESSPHDMQAGVNKQSKEWRTVNNRGMYLHYYSNN